MLTIYSVRTEISTMCQKIPLPFIFLNNAMKNQSILINIFCIPQLGGVIFLQDALATS